MEEEPGIVSRAGDQVPEVEVGCGVLLGRARELGSGPKWESQGGGYGKGIGVLEQLEEDSGDWQQAADGDGEGNPQE